MPRTATVTVSLRLTFSDGYTGEIGADVEDDIATAFEEEADTFIHDVHVEVLNVFCPVIDDTTPLPEEEL